MALLEIKIFAINLLQAYYNIFYYIKINMENRGSHSFSRYLLVEFALDDWIW